MEQRRAQSGRGSRYYVLLSIASALLGVVTTVGVAWAIAQQTRLYSGARQIGMSPKAFTVLRTDPTNFLVLHYPRSGGMECYLFSHGTLTEIYLTGKLKEAREVSPSDLPVWVYLPGPGLRLPDSVPEGLVPVNHLSYAFGWPWLAMRGMIVENSRPQVFAGRDFWTLGPPGGWYEGLPLSPVWSGLLLDSSLFAAVWFVVLRVSATPAWRVVTGARRRARARREAGQCPECGYDLRGDLEAGCPECGWRRES